MNFIISPQSIDLVTKHKKNLMRFIEISQMNGIDLTLGDAYSFQKFLTLPYETQLQIATSFESYLEICEETFQINHSLEVEHLIWNHCAKNKLKHCDDLFDLIDNGDVIEIYDEHFLQVFRSPNFFKVSSYSMSDLLHYSWPDLFQRDEVYTQQLIEGMRNTKFNPIRKTQTINVPPHLAREKRSKDKLVGIMRHKVFSPLFNTSDVVEQILCTFTIKILNQ